MVFGIFCKRYSHIYYTTRLVLLSLFSFVYKLVKSKPDYEMALRVFLKSSERTRHYTSRFFNKTAFYIREAKLVCRDPVYEGTNYMRADYCLCHLSQK